MTADAQRCPGYSRYKLISLLEIMKRLNVAHLFGLAGKLGLLEAAWDSPTPQAAPTESSLPLLIREYQLVCRFLGFQTADEIAKQIQHEKPAHPTAELEAMVRELRRVMEAELKART